MSRRTRRGLRLGLVVLTALALAVVLTLAVARDLRGPLSHALSAVLEMCRATRHSDAPDGGRPMIYWQAGPHGPENDGRTPVILVHGAGGDAVTSWFRLLPALAREREVLAPQLPYADLAASSSALEDFFLEQTDIIRIMDHRGLDKVCLVGLSAGAWVSSLVAMNFPHRVERLVLVSPMGLETEAVLQPLLDAEHPGRTFVERLFHSPPPLLWLYADSLAEPVDEALAAMHKALTPKMVSDMDLVRRLDLVRCPTLVISGDDDRIIPASVPRALAEGIPDARLEILQGCGHAVVWDRPEELERAVSAFLETGP